MLESLLADDDGNESIPKKLEQIAEQAHLEHLGSAREQIGLLLDRASQLKENASRKETKVPE